MSLFDAQVLSQVLQGQVLEAGDMRAWMHRVMGGEVSPVMLSAILIALRVRRETVGEIAAAAQVMREHVTPVEVADRRHLVDIVGTGGDGQRTFNISTCSMFVAAAAGARVSKHGGRSVSSSSGSADVLEALGMPLTLSPEAVAHCIAQVGLGFMFAPNHHPAMKHVAPVRKELGVRTLFNVLGPLTNPASAPHILMGVFSRDWVGVLARVLQSLGVKHAVVVHGADGLDEVTLDGVSYVGECKDGVVSEYEIHPEDFGLCMASSSILKVQGPEQSLLTLKSVLQNQEGPARDIVAFNAGMALYVADVVPTIKEGVQCALSALADLRAFKKLNEFVSLTKTLI
jgi:anthranilate phosphoribosyltransferase